MTERPSKSRDRGPEEGRYRIELVGWTNVDKRPEMAVQLVDDQQKVMFAQRVETDGSFTIPVEVLADARHIVLGAPNE